jgi:alpha-aminoadipic semialdehyde synthase
MRYEDYRITLASADLQRAIQLCESYEGKANPVLLDVNDLENLEELISSHDLVLSMVPPPFHPRIAEFSIKFKKHFISASYISNEMKELHQQAKDSNIILLNEIGLDPGIDHMS